MKTTTEQPSRKFNLRGLFTLICTTLVSTLSFGRALILPLKKQTANLPVKKLTLGFASLLTLIAAAAFFRGDIEQWSKKRDEQKNGEQQINNVFVGQTCEGEFTITATRSYDPNTNQTTYTYQICQTGAKNALSHWGFPIELCPGETQTIEEILAGSVAQTSLDGIDWTSASTSYGKDPSTNPQCTSGDVLKFEESMEDETCRYYRLIVNGSFTLIPISGYIKYGPRCCNFTLENGGCLEEICIPPSATFTGPDNVCPGSTNTYTGPDGNDTYTWTITAGTATIVGLNTNQSVNVMAGPTCGTYTLSLSTTKDDCLNSSSQTFNIVDAAPPVFTGTFADVMLGCNPGNPAGSLGSATATDACGTVTVTSSDGGTVTDGCSRSQTRTFTATDGCNNTATTSRTVRWISDDNTPPAFTGSYADVDLDCNPADPAGSLGSATATDACGAVTVTSSDGGVVTDGCNRSQTRTFTATDECNNTSTTSRTVRWISDLTPPAFTGSYADVDLGCNPADPAGSLGSATATDVCGAVTVTSSDGGVVNDGCNRSQTRTFTATDECDNTSTTSRTVRWISDDNTPPAFTGSYADVDLGCNPADPAGSLGSATATDVCGAVTVTSSDGGVVTDGCNRSQTRTFTATDGCNNTSTTSRTVRWISDLTPPAFTGSYADVDLGCNPADPAGSLGSATATDVCGAVTVTSSDGGVVTDGCNRSQTRTFTATDECNNTSTTSRTVRWISDLTPPAFTGSYADVDLGCNPADPAASLGSATATDVCGAVTVTSSDGDVVTDGCNRSQTRTFTATDECNNTSTTSRTVRWISDLTPPEITTGGGSLTLGCNPSAGDIEAALGTATASDNCSGEVGQGPLGCVASYKGNNGGGNCPDLSGFAPTGTITLFFSSSFTVAPTVLSVTDNDPASDLSNILFGPGDLSNDGLSAEYCYYDGPNNNNNLFGAGVILTFNLQFANGQGCTEQIPVGSITPVASDGPVVSDGCNRSQTRTWIATDNCGNTTTAARTATWTADNTAPTITTGGTTTTLGCNPSAGDIDGALGTASATDACSTATVTSSDGSASSDNCSRSQTRTWTAIDACGNISTAARTVTWTADNIPPVITTGGGSLTLGCNPSAGDIEAALGTATASDNCSGEVGQGPLGCVASYKGNNGGGNCPDLSGFAPTGTITLFFSSSFTVAPTVLSVTDNDPASDLSNILFGPGDLSNDGLSAEYCYYDGPNNNNNLFGAGVILTFNLQFANGQGCTEQIPVGSITPVASDGPVVSDGCNRSQTRTWIATDNCGNTTTAARTATWTSDVTPPEFTGSYADVDLGCNPADPAGSLGSATATDVCGAVTVTSSDGGVVTDGCNRSQTRTFTATDECNNTSTTSRTVRWISDLTPPAFTGSYADVDLGCNPADPAGSLGSATATDVCGAVTVTSSDGDVVTDGCNRSQTRTFTATDECNNTSTTSRTVRWISDLTPPAFTGSYADVDLGCNPADPAGSLGSATATDVCGAVTVTSSDGDVVTDGCNRSQTRTFTATDECNNTSTTSRTVRWISDLTPPAFTGSYADVDLGCNPADPAGSLGSATATDVCGAVTVTSSDGDVVTDGCNRSQTRTFTATDECNNTSTTSRTVRWISDLTPPEITTGGGSLTLGCNPSAGDIEAALGTATASDNCSETGGGPLPGSCVREYKGNNGGGNCPDLSGFAPTGTITLFFSSSFTVAPTVLSVTDNDPASDLSNILFGPGDLSNDGLSAEYCYYDGPNNNNNLFGAGVILTFNLQFANGQGCTEQIPVGSITPVASDGPVVSDGCNRSQTRTWIATDNCGNTTTAARTATWTSDVTPPEFTGSYADVDLGCNPADPAGSLGSASATDVCGAVTVTSSDGDVVTDGCNRSQTRTFTATDECNNTSTTSRTVRWISDLTPPAFTGSYADVDLGCNPADPAGSLGSASATDVCGAVTVTSSDGDVVTDGCNRSQTRTFTATDECNNTSTTSRTVRWISDLTPPAFTGSYADVDLGCNPADPAGSLGSATATDVCGAVTVTSSDGDVVTDGCNRSQTRTFTATDECNNTSTTSRTVRWISDLTPPAFTGSYADVDLGCNPADPAGSLGSATATDVCGAVTVTSSDGDVVTDGCNRSQTRTFTATDECNNTSTTSRTVRWISDLTPPVITTGGGSLTLGCNPSAGDIEAALGTATASDNCSGEVGQGPLGCVASYKGNNGGGNCPDLSGFAPTGTITLFFSSSFTVAPTVLSVTDNDPASDLSNILFGPGDLSNDGLSAEYCYYDGPNNNNNLFGAGVILTFNLQFANGQGCTEQIPVGSITPVASDGPVVSDGCNRSQTRTWIATDNCGNTTTAARTATWTSDVIPPEFTGSYADVDLGCNPADPAGSLGSASATDVCGAVTVTSSDGGVVTDGCNRSQTRTFTATDECNNTSTTSRTVRWISDLTPPAFTGSYADVDLGCNPADPAGSLGSATATDVCGAVTVTSSDGDVVTDGCNRSQTRTFTATDECNNTSTTSRTVRWISDLTPPAFTGSYADVDLGCNPADPAGSLGSATATDVCGAVTVTSSDGDVVTDGCNRSQTRTFTATDECNNTSTTSRTVRWISDLTPPAFTGGYADVDLGCNPADPAGSLGSATATDVCGAVTVTSSDGDVVTDGCNRSQTRTFTATDECNNTSTTSRTVRWISDLTPPVITTGGGSLTLGCNPSAGDIEAALGTATASDNCSGEVGQGPLGCVASYKGNNGGGNCPDLSGFAPTGTITLFFSSSFTVAPTVLSVTDNDPASDLSNILFGPGDLSNDGLSAEYCYYDGPNNNNNLFGAGVILTFNLQFANGQGCTEQIPVGSITPVASDGPVVSDGCNRSQTRTWIATDNCGNTTTAARTATWTSDVIPPEFTGSYADVDLGCNPADPAGSLGSASATDVCGAVTVTSSDGGVVTDGCNRSQTRTFTATDECNNTSTTSRTVRWISDLTPPAFTGSYADVDLGCNPADPAGSLGSATATDVCGAVTVTSSDGDVVTDGCNRSQTRTFTATDECNNTSTTSRTVRWISDLTPPAFTGSYADVDLGCNPADPAGSLGSATATDVCGAVTVTSSDGDVVTDGCNRSQTRTFTATDECNNTSTTSRTVRWISDLTPPAFTGSYADVDLGCNPADPAGSLGSATATDVCGAVTVTSSDGDVVTDGCNRSQTRTFTATDECNNTSTTSRTVRWISDLTPPAFTGSYADVDLGCNPADPAGSLGSATATDVCGAVTVTSSDGDVVTDGCNRSQTRTFTATDECNNTSTTSRTVRWISDLTPPAFTGSYADVDLGCNPADPAGSLGSASATDVCGAVTVTSSDGGVVTDGCNRSQTRTFTATDECNNTSTTSRTVRWISDLTPPAFTGSYADVDLGCNPADPAGSLGSATATDVCGAVTVTSSDGDVVTDGCNRSQTRTFTATDECNNTSTTSRTVRWISDLTPPAFTGSYADVDLGCNPADPAGSLGSATATDVCGAVTVTSSDGGVVTDGCNRSQTRTFTATDECNNTSTTSRTVRWISDLTPPAFTGSYADVDLGCNPADPAGSLGSATATDVCGAVTVTSSDGDVVTDGCNRSQTRTFTATDECNNTSTTSRTVRWISDLTPPEITTGGGSLTLGCNPSAGDIEAALGTATASDNCSETGGGPLPGSCVREYKGNNGGGNCPDLGSLPPTGTITLFFTSALTTAPTVLSVTDNDPTTDLSDVLFGPGDLSNDGLSAEYCYYVGPNNNHNLFGAGVVLTFNLQFANGQGCTEQAPGSLTPIASDGPVVSDGCNRSQTRTWIATDNCGNTTTAARTATWTSDVIPPEFTGSYADVDLGCNPADPAGSLGSATATDVCGAVTVTSSDGGVVTDGCNRSQTRTFTATDECNNTSTTSRTVRWISDLTPPAFTGSYADVDLGCNPADPAGSLGSATATDVCGAVTVTSSDGDVVTDGCNRSQTRTFTATDECNNTSTTSRTVRWISDLTPPAFTGTYADVDLGCNPADPAGSLGSASATDVCGAVTVTSSDGDVVTDGCNRSQTRTFTATDECDNTSTTSRTVRWISDLTPPAFTGSYADVDLGCNPADPAGSLGSATATDVCGAVTVTSSDGDVVTDGCNRSQTRTFTATDECNNTSTTSRTVRWISDLTPPAFTGSYADVDLGCNPADPAGSLGSASATDVCGAVTVTSSDGDVVTDGCNRSQTRTFTATDECNNTSTTSRTVRWISDLTPPAFTGSYADVDLGCNPADPAGSLGSASATDVCGAVTVTSSDGDVVTDGCNRSQTRTFTATDECDNTSTTSRTVRWISDLTPPAFTGSYADVDLGCNPADPAGSLGSASATDVCGAVTVTSSDGDVVTDGCNRSQTRTFTATDECNNTSTTSRTVRWISDLTPPAFTGSYADVDLGCNPADPAGSLGSATATDVCGAVTVTSSDGDVVTDGCNRSQTRTFTATDECDNTSTTSRTVRWISDLTPPAFTGSYADVDLGCNPADPAGSLGSATATDVCGAVTVTSSDGDVVTDGCNRSQTRTFTATDECDNTSTTSRTVRWISDLTPPEITTGGGSLTLGCNPSAGDIEAALGTATASDNCSETGGGPLPGSCVREYKGNNGGGNCPDLGSLPPTGTITLFFTSALTTAPTVLSVTDNDPTTDLSDVLFGPGDLSNDGLSAEYCYYVGPNNNHNLFGAGVVLTFNLQFANGQGCTEQIPVGSITPVASDGPVVSDGCNRSQTRTWIATDNCGNTTTAARTATWTSDVTPPEFTGSYADVDLGCNPADPAGSLGSATATDVCGAVTVTSSDGGVVTDGCNRSQTRTFTATDECDNTSTTSRTVRWISDLTPPAFTGSYADVDLGCNPADPAGSLGSATATDVCGAVTVTSSDGDVVTDGCNRSQTRTFTATDECNNTSTTSRTVRWISDLTPPAFTGSYADVDLGCNPADPAGSLGSATATDVCGAVTVTSSDGDVVTDGCNRSQTRTFTATDECNNTSTTSRTVRWISDLTPPAFTGSYADVDLGCNPADPAGSLGSATATDVCGAVTVTSSDGDVVTDGCNRSQTRTFTATDECNNTSTTSRTVRWISDLTPPAFTGSYADVDLGCNPADPAGSLGSATATDVCGAVTVTSSDGDVVTDGCNRSQTRTFTATDECNNTSTTSRTVRWISDLTPPAFTGSYADVDLGCNPADPAGSLGSATATDVCGAVTVTSSDGDVVTDGCNRSQTRTFTATDECDNTSTTSRTVRWISDLTPPAFTGSYADVDLGCNPADPAGSLGSATATDVCGAVTVTSSDGDVVTDGCNRSQTRTFTATDECDNTSTTSRTVRWISDLTPPAFTGSYADVDLGCNPADPAGSLGSATATDVCGAVTVTSSDGDVVTDGCNRSQTRTFTATDECNNTSTTSRTVRWISDLTPPAFTGSYADVDLGCNPADPAGSLGSASATDVCGAVTVTSSDGDVVTDGCNRSQTRTFTATDECNNTSTTSRTVRWISDLTPPAFTGSYADVDLGCNPADPAGSLGSASATDVCGAVTVTSSDGDVVTDGCNRSQTRTFTATDECNNTSTTSRTVRWISDLTPPAFTGSYADVDLGCNPADPAGSLGSASATDVCGAVTVTSSDGDVVTDGCNRSQTRTFTATDECDNTSTTSRTVRWISDLTPPAFTGSYADVDLGCNPADPAGSLGSATATDVCGAVTVTSSDGDVVTDGCNRSQTRTFTATDGCNNTATTSRTARWTADLTPPVFTSTPASVDLDCLAAIPSVVTPTASDACGTTTVTMTGSTDDPADCTTGFKRIITRTWIAIDACGNTATYTQTIRVKCCETVCTLTQGAYGNPGGNICLPNGTTVNQTQIMIDALTAASGNMVVFGRQDLNRYWVIRLSDVNQGNNSNIFNMLPGGGPSQAFDQDNVDGVPEYDNAPSWPIAPLETGGPNAGQIRNQLFSQTLTLYFNTTIAGSTLANVNLDGSWAVLAPRNCGSSEPAGAGTPTQLVSPAISSYLATHGYATTVAGLLQLANDALGGVDVSPLTLSQIQEAVANINEVFDECRILTGYVPAGGGSGRVITSNSTSSQPSLIVTAFPNPYVENFSLRINSPVTGQAMISFYTMDGVKVGEMKRDVVANRDVLVPYNVPAVYRTRIVYTVTVGGYHARGLVLSPN